MTVNKERMELFAAALESDEYIKVEGRLRRHIRNPGNGIVYGHCALGVMTDVAMKNGLFSNNPAAKNMMNIIMLTAGSLPEAVAMWYGLESDNGFVHPDVSVGDMSIADCNDSGYSFWEIAQMVRAHYLKDE